MGKQKSVGLLLGVTIEGRKFVVLSRRGLWNPEKEKPFSFRGLCQVTVHGKVREGENFTTALLREAEEEVGLGIQMIIEELVGNSDYPTLTPLTITDDDDKEIRTYFLEIDFDEFLAIMPELSSNGTKLVPLEDVEMDILPLSQLSQSGREADYIIQRELVVMFDDEREAVLAVAKQYS